MHEKTFGRVSGSRSARSYSLLVKYSNLIRLHDSGGNIQDTPLLRKPDGKHGSGRLRHISKLLKTWANTESVRWVLCWISWHFFLSVFSYAKCAELLVNNEVDFDFEYTKVVIKADFLFWIPKTKYQDAHVQKEAPRGRVRKKEKSVFSCEDVSEEFEHLWEQDWSQAVL